MLGKTHQNKIPIKLYDMRQNYSNIIGMGIMTDLKSQQLVLITFTSITSLPSKKYTLVL